MFSNIRSFCHTPAKSWVGCIIVFSSIHLRTSNLFFFTQRTFFLRPVNYYFGSELFLSSQLVPICVCVRSPLTCGCVHAPGTNGLTYIHTYIQLYTCRYFLINSCKIIYSTVYTCYCSVSSLIVVEPL